MIEGCHGDLILFKMASYYFSTTEFNIYNRKRFCIYPFLYNSATLIPP